MKIKTLALLLLASFGAFSSPEGETVAKKIDQHNEGFVSERSKMRLVLEVSKDSKVEREMTNMVLEDVEKGNMSLIEFLSPSDIKGTKLLTHRNKSEDDDQWLYLKRSKRVRRISSNNKSASFMGSEFTYEDIGGKEVEKYTHELVGETGEVWVLDRKSKEEGSGYSKERVTFSKKMMSAQKVEYYDRRKELLKTAVMSGFKEYSVNGKSFFRPGKIAIENHQTRKKSSIEWVERKFDVGVKKSDLSKRNLKDD